MERAVGVKASRQRPVEDIEVILGKFSAWSTSHPLEKRPRESIAEISYEQALRAVGYRAPSASPSANEKLPESAGEVHPEPREPKRASPTKGKKTRTLIKKKRSNAKKSEIPNTQRVPRRSSYEAQREVRHLQQEDRPIVVKSSFPELMKLQVGLMEEFSAHQGKSVALTVRLAPGESAVVKARAAEAQVSVSAYMRQCALDVDKLRGQVEAALAELRSANAGANEMGNTFPRVERPGLTASEYLQKPRLSLITRGFRALRLLWSKQSFERVA